MQAATGSPLKVLVVTNDRSTQRRLSHFLDMMRYMVLQAADAPTALAALDAEAPHCLLVDAQLASQDDWRLLAKLSERDSSGGLFKLLLVKDPDEVQLQEAFEAGIDDVLPLPVVFGELLSRLRVAARVLEFDRRVRQQDRVDALTGLPNRAAFGRLAHSAWTHHVAADEPLACVVLDLDFCGRVVRTQGQVAGEALLRSVAAELERLCADGAVLGYLGEDSFGVILPGTTTEQAAQWADQVRASLAAAEFEVGQHNWQITASFGVADGQDTTSSEQLVDRALQALQTAKFSGRGCVARYEEFSGESEACLPPQKLFEDTAARDVMAPCAALLRSDEPVEQAVELLHRTRLEAIPVVDGDGKLLGVCEQSRVAEVPESDYAIRLVSEAMTTDVQSFEAAESFGELMKFFSEDTRSLVVVVEGGRPVGFVTCSMLLALPQPLTTLTLAAESHYCDTSEYLLVPEVSVSAAERGA